MYFSKASKAIASLILSIVLIFSVVPTAFAAESFNRNDIPYEELLQEGYDKEEIDRAAQMMEKYAATYDEKDTKSGSGTRIVANLSVVTRVKGIGHAWIYVENLTDEPLQVGHYTLPANQGVSVGLFSFTCDDGIGIYYNVESYCCNVHGGDGLVSITTDLDEEEMETLSKKLRDYPNHWDPFFNCMYFAFTMWNSVSGRKVIPPVIPAFGQLQLRMHGGTSDNLDMYCPTPDQVLRLKGGLGKEKVLVPVSAGSIDQQIGT
jgi:hypothetical protein